MDKSRLVVLIHPGATGKWSAQPWCDLPLESLRQGVREKVEMLDFCAFFVGKGGLARPFKQTNRLVAAAARAYGPVARMRVKHMWHQMPVELRAAEKLGLYRHDG